nr:DNA replication complex GINS protein PSF3-like [Ipomoea batatas]
MTPPPPLKLSSTTAFAPLVFCCSLPVSILPYQNLDFRVTGFLICRTKDEIGADAAHVDLRGRCPYFYDFGCKIARLTGDKTIGPFLLVAFRTRYKEVLIKAYTAASAVASKHLTLLTQEEMKLYEAGQSSTMAFKKWRMGGPRLHKASVLGRKRKPTQ